MASLASSLQRSWRSSRSSATCRWRMAVVKSTDCCSACVVSFWLSRLGLLGYLESARRSKRSRLFGLTTSRRMTRSRRESRLFLFEFSHAVRKTRHTTPPPPPQSAARCAAACKAMLHDSVPLGHPRRTIASITRKLNFNITL